MEEKLSIITTDRHIEQTYSKLPAFTGLCEVIFNSLDASASKIDITVEYNLIDGSVQKICVWDNGIGFERPNPQNSNDPFLKLGFSNKKSGQTNEFHRLIHGKNGEGRFKAFSLGGILEWKTKTKKGHCVIEANINDPQKITVNDDDIKEIHDTGTIFTAYANEQNIDLPKIDKLKKSLEKYFLTIIQDKRISISLNGQQLSVAEHIADSSQQKLKAPYEDVEVKTVVWATTDDANNRCFWCDEDYNTLLEDRLEDDRKTTNCSVYIASKRISTLYAENRLGSGELNLDFNNIKDAARKVKDAVLMQYNKQKAEDIIAILKSEEIYPYADEAALNEKEKKTQELYDQIIIKINKARPQIFKIKSKEIKKNIANTLKNVIEKDPENFRMILENLIGLTVEEMQDFSDLLKRVSLANMVKTTKYICDRLDFLKGLRQIAYGDFSNIKERSQLHKIVEKESWIFGEQYNLMWSDKSFNTIIGTIRTTLDNFCGTDTEGGQNIPDLFFANKRCFGDEIRGLIVELKRPSVKIGLDEINQIKKYFNVIQENPEFQNWKIDIIIVSSEIKDEGKKEIQDPKTGAISYGNNPDKKLFLRTWADILDFNTMALDDVRKQLEIDPDLEDGNTYLQNKFADILRK